MASFAESVGRQRIFSGSSYQERNETSGKRCDRLNASVAFELASAPAGVERRLVATGSHDPHRMWVVRFKEEVLDGWES
jgi:hypothetical protein